MEKKREKENLHLKIILFIQEILKMVIYMVKVNIYGQMEDLIEDNGKIINNTEKVYLNGLMEEIMKESILKIRNKEEEL